MVMNTREMVERAAHKAALSALHKIVRRHNLSLSSEIWPDYNWDGAGHMCVQDARGDERVSHLCHELAHYLVATPYERRQLEYGLGTSIWAWSDAEEVTRRNPYDVEARASLLGIYLLRALKLHKLALTTLDEHSWSDSFYAVRATTRELIRGGLLVWHNGRLVPRVLVRAPRQRDIFVR